MPITVDLGGLSEALTTVTETAAKRYLSEVAEPCAQVFIDEMLNTVPRDSGVLAEGMGWQKKFSTEDGHTVMRIEIGPLKPYYWGMFQEFGTRWEKGQHWMSRAFESVKDKALDVFAEGARKMVERIKARNAS